MDQYHFYTIGQSRTSTLKIKRSVFTCTLRYADTIESAKLFISKVSKENKSATHNCWAYVLGEKGQIYHSSDAGEPSGTAGKPMLNALQRHSVTNVAAVVTRHFGGVKLGVRGLIDAYFASVENTLVQNKLKKLVPIVRVNIEVCYELNDVLLNQIKNDIIQIKDTSYSDKIVHTIDIEQKKIEAVCRLLSGYESQEKVTFHILPHGTH